MNERYLLDTNTVSYILKQRSAAVLHRLNQLRRETLLISAVTEAELRYGYIRAGVGRERFLALDLFLSRIEVLPWGREEAVVFATLRTDLERSGQPLSSLDTMIVAHAISADAVLVTHDAAMKRVETIRATEDWATDL